MAPRFAYKILVLVVFILPVKLRRSLWRYLTAVGSERWESDGAAQRIPGGMYVKRGILVRPTEGQAMRFIDSLISAPIPVVIDNFKLDGITWLVMSRIPGYNLAACYPDMPPEIEDKLSKQLARILAPIRAISPPTSAVCGFDQGPIRCERLAMGAPPLGPFESVEAFHQFLLDRAGTLNIPEQEADEAQAVIKRAHSRSHRICLTHNDLGPHNVIIDEEWNITGIIDWESCAWMPEYWEATKGTYLPQYRKGRWYRIMMAAFPSYRDEFEAEKYIVNYRQWYT
ncbi:kinase-like protein [Cubamyces lactineus]|nr:kinase-like protein [Cubamyces lactineus]